MERRVVEHDHKRSLGTRQAAFDRMGQIVVNPVPGRRHPGQRRRRSIRNPHCDRIVPSRMHRGDAVRADAVDQAADARRTEVQGSSDRLDRHAAVGQKRDCVRIEVARRQRRLASERPE
jgi:hypothetical protein